MSTPLESLSAARPATGPATGSPGPRRAAGRGLAALLVGGLALCALSGCGSAESAAAGASGSYGSAEQQGGQQQGGQGPDSSGFPGASGLVAAVDGSTAQVQSEQTGQVAVTWTKDTEFTAQVSAALSEVSLGACVMVQADQDADEAGEVATELTAASVRVIDSTDGECSGFGGGQGRGPGGNPPEGAPSGAPEGAPDGAPGGGMRAAVGTVTAKSAGGFTMTVTVPSDSGDAEETEVTVETGSETTFTKTAAAKSGAVKTGVCLRAEGEADTTGAITATTIAISQPVDGSCGGGFGMRSGMPGGPGAGADNSQES